jgi:hypothetical protein
MSQFDETLRLCKFVWSKYRLRHECIWLLTHKLKKINRQSNQTKLILDLGFISNPIIKSTKNLFLSFILVWMKCLLHWKSTEKINWNIKSNCLLKWQFVYKLKNYHLRRSWKICKINSFLTINFENLAEN